MKRIQNGLERKEVKSENFLVGSLNVDSVVVVFSIVLSWKYFDWSRFNEQENTSVKLHRLHTKPMFMYKTRTSDDWRVSNFCFTINWNFSASDQSLVVSLIFWQQLLPVYMFNIGGISWWQSNWPSESYVRQYNMQNQPCYKWVVKNLVIDIGL